MRLLDRAGLAATLLCPLFLLHGRGFADAMIGATASLFLLRSALARDWAWLRTGWVRIALLWWVWMVICSLPGVGAPVGAGGRRAIVQAIVVVRFPLFAAALEHWVLLPASARRWLLRLIQAAALYIALQSAVQFATGRNLFGDPRGSDGELTGPFDKARAAPMFSRMLFPAALPAAARLFARKGFGPKLGGLVLLLGGAGLLVLMGQRMPVLLTGLGLVVSGLLLPRLRLPVAAACVAILALIAASPVVSPQAYHRLVQKFSAQMEHFPESDYGRIAMRAAVIAWDNPLTGRGFDGFRTGCAEPRYFQGWHGGDGGGAAICVQHPHNHYLQAATDSGFPGLALFSALVLAWLLAVGRRLWTRPDPLRVGLFVAVLVQEWPVASTSDFVNMPLGGWFFLLLGFGLAEARAVAAAAPPPYITARMIDSRE